MLKILTEKMLRLFSFKKKKMMLKSINKKCCHCVFLIHSQFPGSMQIHSMTWVYTLPSFFILFSRCDQCLKVCQYNISLTPPGKPLQLFLSFLLYLVFFSLLETIHFSSITHEFISLLFQLLRYKIFQCKQFSHNNNRQLIKINTEMQKQEIIPTPEKSTVQKYYVVKSS